MSWMTGDDVRISSGSLIQKFLMCRQTAQASFNSHRAVEELEMPSILSFDEINGAEFMFLLTENILEQNRNWVRTRLC